MLTHIAYDSNGKKVIDIADSSVHQLKMALRDAKKAGITINELIVRVK